MLWWSSIYIINKHTPFFPLLHLFLYFLFISFFFHCISHLFSLSYTLTLLWSVKQYLSLLHDILLFINHFQLKPLPGAYFLYLFQKLMNLCLSNQNLILTVHMYKYCITIPLHLTCIVKNYIGIFRHGCIVNNFRYNVIFVNSIVEY